MRILLGLIHVLLGANFLFGLSDLAKEQRPTAFIAGLVIFGVGEILLLCGGSECKCKCPKA